MKSRAPRAGGRSIPLLMLAVAVAGVSGSVLSHFLSGLFPEGPVRNFFFGFARIGIPDLALDIEFVRVGFSLQFSISVFAVLLVAVAIYLWYRL